MPNKLSEKVVLITGAGSGIGRATALRFAEEGAKVALADRDENSCKSTADMVRDKGGEALSIKTDISNMAQVADMVTQTIDRYGALHCAVNNAGIEGPLKPIVDMTASDWDEVVNINLRGTFFCLKYEAPAMKKCGGGAIVNIGSVSSFVGFAGGAGYVTAKHGILGLTKTASAEFAAKHIRVNAVCPGVIETPMYDRLVESLTEEQYSSFLNRRTHLHRKGKPEEVAAVAVWLCTDDASYITGAAISPDGGFLAS